MLILLLIIAIPVLICLPCSVSRRVRRQEKSRLCTPSGTAAALEDAVARLERAMPADMLAGHRH